MGTVIFRENIEHVTGWVARRLQIALLATVSVATVFEATTQAAPPPAPAKSKTIWELDAERAQAAKSRKADEAAAMEALKQAADQAAERARLASVSQQRLTLLDEAIAANHR